MKKLLETLVKEHIKEAEYLSDIKGTKLVQIIASHYDDTAFIDYETGRKIRCTSYWVKTTCSKRKDGVKGFLWKIVLYDSINMEPQVFYNGEATF